LLQSEITNLLCESFSLTTLNPLSFKHKYPGQSTIPGNAVSKRTPASSYPEQLPEQEEQKAYKAVPAFGHINFPLFQQRAGNIDDN
jgi:hypothetical protein